MIGTKGKDYYPYYSIPINYFQKEEYLFKTNHSSCYRLIYIEDGIGELYINDARVAVLPRTIICLNENEDIQRYEVTESKLHLLCFEPSSINSNLTYDRMADDEGLSLSDSQDKLLFEAFFRRNQYLKGYFSVSVDTAIRVEEIMNKLMEQLIVQSDSWPCLSRSYLIEMLFLTERSVNLLWKERRNAKSSYETIVSEVLQYIHINYMKKITIEDLTKRLHTNRTTLSRKFKEITGYTIITYLLRFRIQIAATLLRDTSLSVAVIVERVGFSNITHFNQVFKDYIHALPHEYRKNSRCVSE